MLFACKHKQLNDGGRERERERRVKYRNRRVLRFVPMLKHRAMTKKGAVEV